MWECEIQPLEGDRVQRYIPRYNGAPIPYLEVLRQWRDAPAFRTFFVSLLSNSKFTCFRWETPPLTVSTSNRPFEFALLDAPRLERKPDAQAFARQFRAAAADERVLAFPNLGNDAVLVVPRAEGPQSTYVHLRAFVLHAPDSQVHDLWRVIGKTMEQRLTDAPLWLSTAGMGVAWLHVRLDSRPKYYGFAPYRESHSNR